MYEHINQFKEKEISVSKRQYPKGVMEIERTVIGRNIAAHLSLNRDKNLLLRIIGNYRTIRLIRTQYITSLQNSIL